MREREFVALAGAERFRPRSSLKFVFKVVRETRETPLEENRTS